MAELNADICEQGLASCPFCTCVYCVLDVESLMLTWCRAGHPEPLLLRDGSLEPLASPGSLLGVFPGEQYVAGRHQMRPGDRLVLYTDGADTATNGPDGQPVPFQDLLGSMSDLPRGDVLMQITSRIESRPAAPELADDVTVAVMDIEH